MKGTVKAPKPSNDTALITTLLDGMATSGPLRSRYEMKKDVLSLLTTVLKGD